jgi:ABC-2 type transport system permease protein
MRWLLLKDLQILRRSPLQAVLLIAYPVLIALLIGFAISRDPGKPSVAFLNEIPDGARVAAGETRLPAIGVDERICRRVECIAVADRDEAAEKVRSGDVLAALILPADLIDRLNSLSTPRPETPEVEVIVNEEDPLKAQIVDDRITTLLGEANLFIARRIAVEGGRYLNLIVEGGSFDVLGTKVEILGLEASASILRTLRRSLPEGQRRSLERVIPLHGAFPRQPRRRRAADRPACAADRDRQADGQRPDAAVGRLRHRRRGDPDVDLRHPSPRRRVAGAGARGEHLRPPHRRARLPSALVAEKVGLGVAAGFVVTLLMLVGVQIFVSLDWTRFGLWLVAILAGGAASPRPVLRSAPRRATCGPSRCSPS